MYRRIAFLLLLIVLLTGCNQEQPVETAPLCRFVTRADITCYHGGQTVYKQYTQDRKIESVLYYLRLLQDKGELGQLPRDAEGVDYEIRLFFSDGTVRSYRQKGIAFISQNQGPWRILKPRQGRKLLTLFRLLSSDI